MNILVTTDDNEIAERIKEILLSFGKGMHIHRTDYGITTYGCAIAIGDAITTTQDDINRRYSKPATEDDWQQLEKELWHLYRDYLKDMIGGRCSCGMFEFCHCH